LYQPGRIETYEKEDALGSIMDAIAEIRDFDVSAPTQRSQSHTVVLSESHTIDEATGKARQLTRSVILRGLSLDEVKEIEHSLLMADRARIGE
jgi:hypothetical protein